MSIPLRFDILDETGSFICNTWVTSTNNVEDIDNLNRLHEKLFEFLSQVNRGFICLREEAWENRRYAVPNTVREYMFDIKTGELLPNRFLK